MKHFLRDIITAMYPKPFTKELKHYLNYYNYQRLKNFSILLWLAEMIFIPFLVTNQRMFAQYQNFLIVNIGLLALSIIYFIFFCLKSNLGDTHRKVTRKGLVSFLFCFSGLMCLFMQTGQSVFLLNEYFVIAVLVCGVLFMIETNILLMICAILGYSYLIASNKLVPSDLNTTYLQLSVLLVITFYISRSMFKNVVYTFSLNQRLQIANSELQLLSQTDPLTGLFQRRGFEHWINGVWQESIMEQRYVCGLMLDVDYFKKFNDTYGHQSGDQVLVEIANCIKSALRTSSDFVTRYGGEEFLIILRDVEEHSAYQVGLRILEEVNRRHIEFNSSPISDRITLSIGVAQLLPIEGSTYHELVESADQACYRAKDSGRNCVVSHMLMKKDA